MEGGINSATPAVFAMPVPYSSLVLVGSEFGCVLRFEPYQQKTIHQQKLALDFGKTRGPYTNEDESVALPQICLSRVAFGNQTVLQMFYFMKRLDPSVITVLAVVATCG
jgi:hypothetical protein